MGRYNVYIGLQPDCGRVANIIPIFSPATSCNSRWMVVRVAIADCTCQSGVNGHTSSDDSIAMNLRWAARLTCNWMGKNLLIVEQAPPVGLEGNQFAWLLRGNRMVDTWQNGTAILHTMSRRQTSNAPARHLLRAFRNGSAGSKSGRPKLVALVG